MSQEEPREFELASQAIDQLSMGTSDTELHQMVARALASVDRQKLGELIESHQRFNEPVKVRDADGTWRVDNHAILKDFLRELPESIHEPRCHGELDCAIHR